MERESGRARGVVHARSVDNGRRVELHQIVVRRRQLTMPSLDPITIDISRAAFEVITTAGGPRSEARECLRTAQERKSRVVLGCSREAAIEIRDWFLGAARLAMRQRGVERGGACAAAAAIGRALCAADR